MLGQLANAFACRSQRRWVGHLDLFGNRLLLYAVGFEIAILGAFLTLPPLPRLLGGTLPDTFGWLLAAATVPAVLLADALHKATIARHRR